MRNLRGDILLTYLASVGDEIQGYGNHTRVAERVALISLEDVEMME